jgi:hypothetical protein
MGCVYIDTCSTILPGKLNTYNFKNLYVGSTIFFFKKLENAKKIVVKAGGGFYCL